MTGCSKSTDNTFLETLVIYSPHPIEFIDPIIIEFENETGVAVEVMTAGTGELLKRIESEQKTPVGDVLWGGSLSSLESNIDLFEAYKSSNESHAIYKNTDGYITRFTMMPSVIMVNTNLIGDIKIGGYKDLLNSQLKGKIAYADPSKSSSSFEQLLNQIWAMGDGEIEKGWKYVKSLMYNLDGKLLERSSDVYNGVARGEFIVGLTFEEAAAKYVDIGAPVKIIFPEEGTIIRPDGVSIIKDSKHIENAKKFVDFVTSYDIQVLIANELNRRAIRDDVPQSKGLIPYEEIVVIQDDQKWSSENKEDILERYIKMFNEFSSN